MIRSFYSMHSLFLNTLLFFGLFNSCLEVFAVPVSLVSSSNDASGVIKYPIHVACECMFTLYVDGKYIGEGNKENYVPYGLITEWNDTKKYYPVISENEPKIVAFHGVGGQYPAFLNGFIMDMNDGKQYTRHEEWRCKDFSKTANKVAPENWFAVDYDDSSWDMAASYGANYQNNSFQIFENPRDSVNLNAEWLWTHDNAATSIYCRKKNEHVSTIRVSQTSAPHSVQTSAPHIVQTSAPTVLQMIHAPSPLPLPKVIISPHIQIVIQNIKYSQRRSNAHLENLLRRIKLYNDEYILYRELTLARLHLRRHYKALLYDIKHVLEKHDTDDTDDTDDTHDKSYNKKTVKNIPHFIHSMHTLNASIKKIEQSIHFIKGNHKYILMKILNKLKMRYQEDTQKLFTFFNHH